MPFGIIVMREFTVKITRISRTGVDGGHSYLCGKTVWEGNNVDVFVFLKEKKE